MFYGRLIGQEGKVTIYQLKLNFDCIIDDIAGRLLIEEDDLIMLAMAMFYYHIRITRWGKPNQDTDYVARYLPDMKHEVLKYADYIDLSAHLPGI